MQSYLRINVNGKRYRTVGGLSAKLIEQKFVEPDVDPCEIIGYTGNVYEIEDLSIIKIRYHSKRKKRSVLEIINFHYNLGSCNHLTIIKVAPRIVSEADRHILDAYDTIDYHNITDDPDTIVPWHRISESFTM